jgi:hypothetical protein
MMKMMIHQTLSRPDSSIATIARVWTSSYISYTTTTTTAIVRVLLSCSHPYCHCYYCNQSRWRLTHCDDCYCRLLCIIFRVGYRAYLSVFGMCMLRTARYSVYRGMYQALPGISRYARYLSVRAVHRGVSDGGGAPWHITRWVVRCHRGVLRCSNTPRCCGV